MYIKIPISIYNIRIISPSQQLDLYLSIVEKRLSIFVDFNNIRYPLILEYSFNLFININFLVYIVIWLVNTLYIVYFYAA